MDVARPLLARSDGHSAHPPRRFLVTAALLCYLRAEGTQPHWGTRSTSALRCDFAHCWIFGFNHRPGITQRAKKGQPRPSACVHRRTSSVDKTALRRREVNHNRPDVAKTAWTGGWRKCVSITLGPESGPSQLIPVNGYRIYRSCGVNLFRPVTHGQSLVEEFQA